MTAVEEVVSPSSFPWGIEPSLLLSQVRNTAPFLFEPAYQPPAKSRFIKIVREFDVEAFFQNPDLATYFELCVAAHYSTVATFVPTDVDNHIRVKLWHKAQAQPNASELLQRMTALIEEVRDWDVRPVSTRWIASPVNGEPLAGHMGEWFSIAAGCYAALLKHDVDQAASVAGWMLREVQREARIFTELKSRKDGIGALIASTIIAHNLGDLVRVLDLWKVSPADPLREAVVGGEALRLAGELNKTIMAVENHRHFALREPRGLRRHSDLLLPTAPFLDEWGSHLARHPGLSDSEKAEVVEALIGGWERLHKSTKPGQVPPVGYARALLGFEQSFKGGQKAIVTLLPSRVAKALTSGPLRVEMGAGRKRFEEQWAAKAMKTLERLAGSQSR